MPRIWCIYSLWGVIASCVAELWGAVGRCVAELWSVIASCVAELWGVIASCVAELWGAVGRCVAELGSHAELIAQGHSSRPSQSVSRLSRHPRLSVCCTFVSVYVAPSSQCMLHLRLSVCCILVRLRGTINSVRFDAVVVPSSQSVTQVASTQQ